VFSGPSRALVLLNTEGGGITIIGSVPNTDPTIQGQNVSSTALCTSNVAR
jgi:hypothetical protein